MHIAIVTCSYLDIESIVIVDNWDNLSSKSVLLKYPDKLLVWSDQMADHAQRIQGMQSCDIKVIGSARFDHYQNIYTLYITKTLLIILMLFLSECL